MPDMELLSIDLPAMIRAFKDNVKYRYNYKLDLHEFNCKKGLFGTACKKKHIAEKEAMHYFQQYYRDGEYE